MTISRWHQTTLFTRGIFRVFFFVFLIRLLIEFFTWSVFKNEGSPLLQLGYRIFWIMGEMILLALFFNSLLAINSCILRALCRVVLFLFLLIAILISIADPIIVKLAGDHLTPSLLQHFAGPKIFLSDELWLPIKKNIVMVLFGMVSIGSILFLFSRLIKRNTREQVKLTLTQNLILVIASMVLLLVPYLINGRFLQYPGEAIFMRNVLGWDRYQPNGRDIENLQTFLSLPKDSQATYPLLTFIEPSTPHKPNIILYVIESLRGSDIKTFNSKGSIEMTSFDRFAKSGINFPHFISNGYPSTEGFLSLAMGTWPHTRERLVISHQYVEMPSLANQLNKKGYSSYRIEDRDDPGEEGHWIKPTFDHHITFTYQKRATEKHMIDTLIHIMENDQEPLYIHLKTRNPHYPYEISNDSTNRFYQIGEPSENYPASLSMIDKHLNRLYDYLEKTKKLENTIIIITGDHSNILDKTHQSPLPYNETVWTGAIIAGDSSLIGNPRIDQRNCSQVDISTTLLNLTGGNCNWVGFGQNLLKSPDKNYAIAIRPAGIRLDYKGYSYLLSRSEPTKYQIKQAFPDLEPAIEPMPPLTPEELFNLVDSWAYLIDNNRAFDDTEKSNQ